MLNILKVVGAGDDRQAVDYYATDPQAIDKLLEREEFRKRIWEPACGGGHLSFRLKQYGYMVTSTDLVVRDAFVGVFPKQLDFLQAEYVGGCDIITNPPFKLAQEFVEHALKVTDDNAKIAMFLKLQFLEGEKRRKFFHEHPPAYVYVFSKRMKCAKNGDFDAVGAPVMAYAWYIWRKGWSGEPRIRWI